MNESMWLASTDLHGLLYYAKKELGFDRKIRMFSVACVKRVLCAYNAEVACLLDAAEQFFDEGFGSLKDVQAIAQTEAISLYHAPFQLARYDSVLSALGVLEGIVADTGWKDHGCLPVFREIMGNPFKKIEVQADPLIAIMAEEVYSTGANAGPLADALSDPELANHLREVSWHPKGCWVLDLILNKRK